MDVKKLKYNLSAESRDKIYNLLKMNEVKDREKVLLAFLGQPLYALKLQKQCPNSDIFILEDKEIECTYCDLNLNTKFVNSVNIIEIEEALKNMKFDKIIMNPPYDKSLHLKILDEAINHSDNIVNLSPIRWLQDPLAKYKKGSDFLKFENIKSRLSSLDVIPALKAWSLFNAQFTMNLGIYSITKDGGFDCDKFNTCKLFEKAKKYFHKEFLLEFSEKNENDIKAFVPIRCWTNPLRMTCYNAYTQDAYFVDGRTPNGTYWRDALYKGNGTNIKDDRSLIGIAFKNKESAKNYYLSLKTFFMKYYVKNAFCNGTKILPEYLPYMGDEINPRTGLKGYESEWTDEDFYEFFGITDEEKKIIEETMKKYE